MLDGEYSELHKAMTDLIGRLRNPDDLNDQQITFACIEAADELSRLQAENERLLAECEEWRHCALYDAMMDGPRFKGWNRSSLDRCRSEFIEKSHSSGIQSNSAPPGKVGHSGATESTGPASTGAAVRPANSSRK